MSSYGSTAVHTFKESSRSWMLISDVHLGATNCDLKLFHSTLQYARDTDSRILINGDLFDALVPSDSSRFVPDSVHPRLRSSNDILGSAVDWAVSLLHPYHDLIDMVGMGNHEVTVEEKHGVDLIKLLIGRLSPRIRYGGYSGFLFYKGLKLFYHHGMKRTEIPHIEGVDVIWSGHFHTKSVEEIIRLSALSSRKVSSRSLFHIQTGSFLTTYAPVNGSRTPIHNNYSVKAGWGPQGKGGCRVILFPDGTLRVEQ